MKLIVNTVIVDDAPMYAEAIYDVLMKRNKENTLIQYIPNVFCKRGFYSDAKDYILQSINNNIAIDLIYCDYHLGPGINGIDLFTLFTHTLIRPYRMLHSNTTRRFSEHSKEFIDGHYDQFSPTKDSEMIEQNIMQYENEILKIKLFGNPRYIKSFYANKNGSETIIEKKYRGINLTNLLYVHTKDDDHSIVFRNIDPVNGSVFLDSLNRSGKDYRIDNFIASAGDFEYLRLNQSILLNLLWVSKIDTEEQKVHFITPNSKRLIIDSYNTVSKFISKDFDFKVISDALQRYFL